MFDVFAKIKEYQAKIKAYEAKKAEDLRLKDERIALTRKAEQERAERERAEQAIRKAKTPQFSHDVGRIAQLKRVIVTMPNGKDVMGCTFWLDRSAMYRPERLFTFSSEISARDGHRVAVIMYVLPREQAVVPVSVFNGDSQQLFTSKAAEDLVTEHCRQNGLYDWPPYFKSYIKDVRIPPHL